MKTIKTIMMLVLSATLAFAQGSGFIKTIKVEKGASLEVHLNPGDINVKTGNENEIIISAPSLDKEEFEDVSVKKGDKGVYVEYDSDWGWSDDLKFTFTVPPTTNLVINTSGGDIKVEDELIGEVSLKTSGGDVKVNVVRGKLQVNTSGGDIRVNSSTGDMSLQTSGGDINVGEILGKTANLMTMGGDITIEYSEASLKARTMGGDIQVGDVGGNATVTTMGGDIELENVSGSVKMETYGGDLELKSSTGKVEAETKGGDITLQDVKGSLLAKTYGGDIFAELYPDQDGSSYLQSYGGDLRIKIPESAKVSIVAKIKITQRRNREDYKIKSIITGESWEYKDGERYIEAEFDVNGGGHQIKLETVNSNIIIDNIK